MGKMIASERITLDGFVTGPEGDMDWMAPYFDAALTDYEFALQESADTVLFGRETFQAFERYWPGVAADAESPEGMIAYANRLTAMDKIVFSRTLTRTDWNNTIVLSEIVPDEIRQKKAASGRDMVIYGSAQVVQALASHGLIDQYNLLVHPVILGSGRPLFAANAVPANLALVDSRTHPSGVVVLSYRMPSPSEPAEPAETERYQDNG